MQSARILTLQSMTHVSQYCTVLYSNPIENRETLGGDRRIQALSYPNAFLLLACRYGNGRLPHILRRSRYVRACEPFRIPDRNLASCGYTSDETSVSKSTRSACGYKEKQKTHTKEPRRTKTRKTKKKTGQHRRNKKQETRRHADTKTRKTRKTPRPQNIKKLTKRHDKYRSHFVYPLDPINLGRYVVVFRDNL